MRICVLADTHHFVPLSMQAINEMNHVDLFLHLGDCYIDAKKIHELTGLPYKAVRGNKDWNAEVPDVDFWDIEGVKIMATHGHLEDVNPYDPPEERRKKFEKLARVAKRKGARLVLYGHNHLAEKFYVDEILFFNPGEMVYGCKRNTYGILEISEGEFSLEHVEVIPDASIKW